MAETRKREKVCDKAYIDKAGKETRYVPESATILEFRFTDPKKTVIKFDPRKCTADIVNRLLFHGAAQKGGDSYAGAKGNVSDAIDNCAAVVELLQAGTWTERAEGVGPAPSMVAEAIVAALKKKGERVEETRANAIREKVRDKATREGALADPAIKAEYEAAKAARAAERAKEAATAAKGLKMGLAGF